MKRKMTAIVTIVVLMMAMMSSLAMAEQVGASDNEAVQTEKAEKPTEVKKFKGSVSVSIQNKGKLHYGDSVTLKATVKGAKGISYKLRWEVNDGSGWETIKGENGKTYTFTVTEKNGGYQWRAVMVTEA